MSSSNALYTFFGTSLRPPVNPFLPVLATCSCCSVPARSLFVRAFSQCAPLVSVSDSFNSVRGTCCLVIELAAMSLLIVMIAMRRDETVRHALPGPRHVPDARGNGTELPSSAPLSARRVRALTFRLRLVLSPLVLHPRLTFPRDSGTARKHLWAPLGTPATADRVCWKCPGNSLLIVVVVCTQAVVVQQGASCLYALLDALASGGITVVGSLSLCGLIRLRCDLFVEPFS